MAVPGLPDAQSHRHNPGILPITCSTTSSSTPPWRGAFLVPLARGFFIFLDAIHVLENGIGTACPEAARGTTTRDRFGNSEKRTIRGESETARISTERVDLPMAIKKRKFKSPTLQWTYDRYIGNDPKQIEEYE